MPAHQLAASFLFDPNRLADHRHRAAPWQTLAQATILECLRNRRYWSRSRHLCNSVGRSPRQLAAWVIGLILLGIKKYRDF
jgi:hypothetical protein